MFIDGIKIVKQKRNNTCGYATAGMILNYFQGSNINEDYLLENEPFDEKGITFSKLLEIYKKYLEGYDASLIRDDKKGYFANNKAEFKSKYSFSSITSY